MPICVSPGSRSRGRGDNICRPYWVNQCPLRLGLEIGVDHIVSSTLNGIGHATAAVQEGLSAPLRHISGVIDGLRAGFGSFRRKRPHPNGHAAVVVRKVEQDPY